MNDDATLEIAGENYIGEEGGNLGDYRCHKIW